MKLFLIRRHCCPLRLFLPLAILFSLLPLSCKKPQEKKVELESFPVRTEKMTRRSLEETLTVVGTLKAKDEATLFSRVPGKLMENLVKEGDPIAKGQAVALVERDEVGVRFEPAPVPSTLKGIVGRTYLDRGANVTLNTPVALVVDNTELLAKADIPEPYVGKVRPGLPARVKLDAYPNTTFHGQVRKVSPVVDPQTHTAASELKLDNRSQLLQSGMFAEISIVLERSGEVFSVPQDALLDEKIPFLFLVENGKAVKRPVELGGKSEGRVIVRKGLKEGDEVVTFGLYGLETGSAVEIIDSEKETGN